MLECVDLSEELHRVVSLFSTYLQSQSVGTQQLVLRGILQLSKRQDTVSRSSSLPIPSWPAALGLCRTALPASTPR